MNIYRENFKLSFDDNLREQILNAQQLLKLKQDSLSLKKVKYTKSLFPKIERLALRSINNGIPEFSFWTRNNLCDLDYLNDQYKELNLLFYHEYEDVGLLFTTIYVRPLKGKI